MSDFSLIAVVRGVLDADASEDLSVIIKEVRAAIPADCTDAALDQALLPLVHDVITKQRTRQPAAPSGSGRSSKVQRIRDYWRRQLDDIRYTVADGSVRRIGDMSRDDLLFIAGRLDELADYNRKRADSVRRIADALAEHDAATVRDLPEKFLETAFGRPA